jgi:thiol-disulfide isomerase/thioredoxin
MRIILGILLLFSSNLFFTDSSDELIFFHGSDWCSACKKFEKNILDNPMVIDYLKENNIVVTKIDFPQRKKLSKDEQKRNKEYALTYNFKGRFPTIVYNSSRISDYQTLESNTISPKEFIEWLKNNTKK